MKRLTWFQTIFQNDINKNSFNKNRFGHKSRHIECNKTVDLNMSKNNNSHLIFNKVTQ